MSKLTIIIDEHRIYKEKDLFIRNYFDFLDKWEEIVQMIFKKEKKIIVSHPIVSGYFRNLKYVLGDRIEIIENNPREQLAISLGLGSNELDFLSNNEILENKLLEKAPQRSLNKHEDPYVWLLEQITENYFSKTNILNYLLNCIAFNTEKKSLVEKIVLKLIQKKALDKYFIIKWLKKGNMCLRAQILLSYVALKKILTKEEIEVCLFQDITQNFYEIEELPEEELENIYPLSSLDKILDKRILLQKRIEEKLQKLLEQEGLDKFLEVVSGKIEIEKKILKNWIKSKQVNFTIQDLTVFQEQTIRNKFGHNLFKSLLGMIPPLRPKDLNIDFSIKEVLDWLENEYFPFFRYSRQIGKYDLTEIYVRQFEEWYLTHYEKIIQSDFSSLISFHILKEQIEKSEKTLFLIIDGLGYCFLQDYLSNLKLDFLRCCFCFIPSITATNKPSLLSGRLPNEINGDYVKLAQQLNAIVSNDTRETISAFAQKRFNVGIYFVNSFDDILHKPYTYAVLMRELKTKLTQIFEEISKLNNMGIIITADHGFTVLPNKKENLLKLENIDGEISHNRVVKLNRDVEVDNHLWIKTGKYLQDNYCVARGYRYIENFPKGATHGGITPEEVAVPVILITPSLEEFVPLDIKIFGDIWKQKINSVDVIIENPNKESIIVEDLYIEHLKFSIPRVLDKNSNIISAKFDAREIKTSTKKVKIYYKVIYRGDVYEQECILDIKLKALMQTGWEDIFDE